MVINYVVMANIQWASELQARTLMNLQHIGKVNMDRAKIEPTVLVFRSHSLIPNTGWDASTSQLLTHHENGVTRVVIDVINHGPLKPFRNLPITTI